MKKSRAVSWKCRDRVLTFRDRPLIMGILNVTPDSFSDGGLFEEADRAVARGMAMFEEGADIVDVGGESTRPGAAAVSVEEELRRVVPVVRELCRRSGRPVSVDTMKAEVAAQALECGACIVNDVSALTWDEGMPAVAARFGAGVVLMHMAGTPGTMQQNPQYGDVVAEICAWLAGRVESLVRAGFDRETLAVDPGIGFGKTVEHNLALIAGLDALADGGRPVVLGASRKSFIGRLTGCPVEQRLPGSLAVAALGVFKGAGVVRVHDVKESLQAVQIAAALARQVG